MPPEIVRSASYLIIGGRKCPPGRYNVIRGESVQYVVTVANKVGPERVRVRVVDLLHDRALADYTVDMMTNSTEDFRGSFVVKEDMYIEMQVWVEESPGYWRIYDRYG